MTPKKASLFLVGGAVLMAVIEKWMKPVDPGKATPITVAPDPAQPAAPGAAVPALAAPVLMQGTLQLSPGLHYYATLATHGVASSLASVSRVQSEAQNRGFTGVAVSQSKPQGWPGGANGDYYVSATYSGTPKIQARNEGNFLGSVDVVEAFQG